jgi:hypothetical protein
MKTTAAVVAAASNAICRYAIGMLGWIPRNAPTITTPRMPSSRLTAKTSRVSRNVTSKTRTGIKYQRGLLARLLLGDIAADCNAVVVLMEAHRARPASFVWLVR